MRFVTLSSIVALLSVFCISSFAQTEPVKEKIGYMYVTEPFANVYEKLDPMSPLIRQAKKGEYLEIEYDGESWHKVKIDGKIGWVEKKAGKIVKKAGGAPVGAIAFLILLVIGTIGAVYYFSQKNKTAASGVGDDL